MAQRKRKNNFFFSSPNKHLKNLFPRRIGKLKNPKILLIFGLAFIMLGGVHKIYALTQPTFSGEVPVKVDLNSYPPVTISIPSESINLSIESTFIKNGTWGISKNGVSHLATSSNPGVEGNIIMYAHNTLDRLGRLQGIEKGDKIFLESADGKKFTYVVTNILVVDANNIKKLNESEGEMITIYTCTGFADLQRLLVKAKRLNTSLELQI